MNQTKQMKCYICDQTMAPLLVMKNVKNAWDIKRCPACELTFVDPQPDSDTISAYYNGMYSDLTEKYDAAKMETVRTAINGYLSSLKKYKAVDGKTTLLDIGGGLGYYAKGFSEAGLAVTFVEQDPVSANFARTVLKLPNIIEMSAERFFEMNTAKFDLIFLRHVIEHSTNPGFMIAQVQKCLSEGGILVIETDNNAGIEILFRPGPAKFYLGLYRASFVPTSFFSLLKRRPFAVDPPRHLFGFRMSNLSMLLRRNSLFPVEGTCYRLGHPVYWGNMPLPTLRDMFANARQGKFKQVIANVADVVLTPFRRCLEYLGLASGICIYAIKRQVAK